MYLSFQAANEINLRGGPGEDSLTCDDDNLSQEEDEECNSEPVSSSEPTACATSNCENIEPSHRRSPVTFSEDLQCGQICAVTTDIHKSNITDCCDLDDVNSSSDSADSDVPELKDISLENRELRPLRDQSTREHVNFHLAEGSERQRSGDSMCSSASTSIDPKLVKLKVKRQIKKDQKKQFARRVRKGGEASLVTKQRRRNMDDIKHSAGWDD